MAQVLIRPARAGLTDHLWEIKDLVRMMEEWEPRQAGKAV
jgi:hypothetical protein